MVAPRALARRIRLGFAAVAVIAILAVAALAAIVEVRLRSEIEDALVADLDGAADALAARLHQGRERLASEARVVAEEPRLKAALTTVGMDRATVDDMADDLRQTTHWDLVALVGTEGEVRGRSGAAADAGLAQAKGSWRSGGALYVVTPAPVAYGSRLVATLIAGERMSDERITEVTRGTRAQAVVFLDKDVVATTFAKDSPARVGLGDLAAPRKGEIVLGGERFLGRPLGLDDLGVSATVLTSIDAAERPLERIRAVVWGTGGAAILLILVVAWAAGRRLGRAATEVERVAEASVLARFNTPS